jgi:hypothetical protein
MGTPGEVVLSSGRTVAAVLAAAELPADIAGGTADAGAGGNAGAGADAGSRGLVDALIAEGRLQEGAAFLAHALPRREGTWWAWLCARTAAGEEPQAAVAATLEATRHWIAEPTDAHRRAAFAYAEQAGLGTAVGFAAIAAFLSGESVAPPNVPPVPPGEWDAAKAVAATVIMAAAESRPDDADGAMREFLQQGLELADRVRLWQPATESAP